MNLWRFAPFRWLRGVSRRAPHVDTLPELLLAHRQHRCDRGNDVRRRRRLARHQLQRASHFSDEQCTTERIDYPPPAPSDERASEAERVRGELSQAGSGRGAAGSSLHASRKFENAGGVYTARCTAPFFSESGRNRSSQSATYFRYHVHNWLMSHFRKFQPAVRTGPPCGHTHPPRPLSRTL